jgi:hypothetical protein
MIYNTSIDETRNSPPPTFLTDNENSNQRRNAVAVKVSNASNIRLDLNKTLLNYQNQPVLKEESINFHKLNYVKHVEQKQLNSYEEQLAENKVKFRDTKWFVHFLKMFRRIKIRFIFEFCYYSFY